MADLPEWGQRLVAIGVVVLCAAIVTWVLRFVMRRLTRRVKGTLPSTSLAAKRAQTLGSVLGAVGVVFIWLTAFVMALEIGGVPVGPLIATAGIGGVALGFGMQNLVRDCVAGLFLLSENQYDVGDSVKIAGVEGTVEAITLRSTVLRGQDGARHVVSNGEVRVSTNTTRMYSRCLVTIPVALDADIDRALEAMRRVTGEMAKEHADDGGVTGPPTVLGVSQITSAAVELTCFLETLPGRQFALGRELRRRLLAEFKKDGVRLSAQANDEPEPQEPVAD